MTATLKTGAINIAPRRPATAAKNVLGFPISGGRIVGATFAGTLNHTGGLTFRHHAKSVTLNHFVINTHTKQVSASVRGKSLPIFDLNLASLKRVSERHRTIVATNIKLTVTSNAARALNRGLGVTTFNGAQHFGSAILIVVGKP
jgi:hypothetical protein